MPLPSVAPPSPEVVAPIATAAVPPPVVASEAAVAAPEGEAAAPRVSPRRHDPTRRLKRMLRILTEHDVPLVADLTRADHTDAEAGLAAFVDTVAAHLDRAPGLVLTVVGDPEAPIGVAEALAAAIEARGHSARAGESAATTNAAPHPDDLVVETLAATEAPPPVGAHPFTLLVVEASRACEERLPELIELWESDPERVLVAAFVPPAVPAD